MKAAGLKGSAASCGRPGSLDPWSSSDPWPTRSHDPRRRGSTPNCPPVSKGARPGPGLPGGGGMGLGAFGPRTAVILPVRGLEEGFDNNVRAPLTQGSPRTPLLVVVDDSADPAV